MENHKVKNVFSEMVPSSPGFTSSDESLCLNSLWKERFCVETKTVPLANDYDLNDNELPDLEIIEVNSNERIGSKLDTFNNNNGLKFKPNTNFSSDFGKKVVANLLDAKHHIQTNPNNKCHKRLSSTLDFTFCPLLKTKRESKCLKISRALKVNVKDSISNKANSTSANIFETFENRNLHTSQLGQNKEKYLFQTPLPYDSSDDFLSDVEETFSSLPNRVLNTPKYICTMEKDNFSDKVINFKRTLRNGFTSDIIKPCYVKLVHCNYNQQSLNSRLNLPFKSTLDNLGTDLISSHPTQDYCSDKDCISEIVKDHPLQDYCSDKDCISEIEKDHPLQDYCSDKDCISEIEKDHPLQDYCSDKDCISEIEKDHPLQDYCSDKDCISEIEKDHFSDKVINFKRTLRNGFTSDVIKPCFVKLVRCDYNQQTLNPRLNLPFKSTLDNLGTDLIYLHPPQDYCSDKDCISEIEKDHPPQDYFSDKDCISEIEKDQTNNSSKHIASNKNLMSEFSISSELFYGHPEGKNILGDINMEMDESTLHSPVLFSKFINDGNRKKSKKKKNHPHPLEFSTGMLNFIDINLDSGKLFFHRAIEDIWGFISTTRKPPCNLVTRIIQDILLDSDSKNLATSCYTLLCHIVSLHDITGPVPWWALLETIMSNLEHCDSDIKRYSIDLALQWIVDVIEKNLCKREKSIDKSLAKRLFWNVNRDSRIKTVVNWIRLALSQISNQDYYSNKKSANITVLILCQKLLQIAVFVSDKPVSTANIISNELTYLYLYQPSFYYCKLFLNTLKCHLVCRNLVLTLLENYCQSPVISSTFSLTVRKIVEVYFKCSPRKDQHTPPRSPQDNDNNTENMLEVSCDELIHFLFYLLDSHLTITSNELYRPSSKYNEIVTWNPKKLKNISSDDVDCLKNMTTHIENLHQHLQTFCPTFTKVQGMQSYCLLSMIGDMIKFYN